MSLGQRIRAEESYGVLFALIILSLTASAAVGSFASGPVLAVVMQAGVLLYALWTSRAGRHALRVALIVLPIVVIVAFVFHGATGLKAGIAPFMSVVLTASAIGAIVRRVAQHPRVDAATILGVLSVYLLLGMLFAAAYSSVAGFSGQPFFVSGPARSVDYTYFSFVTITTTGYGDFVAGTDLGRMMAVTEALLGQLYLVSVVAFVVGNAGRERRRA